jgi:GNAT superfamily N-acetyltransferase
VPQIVEATDPAQLEAVRELFREYQASLAFDKRFVEYLDVQAFEAEITSLPARYARPDGRLLFATVDSAPVGCVALQPIDRDRCEMKRMYVRPNARGRSVGRVLAQAIVDHAREAGYRRMLLDTLPHMREAIALYRSIGFRDTARYRYNPIEESLFFELIL